MSPVVVIALDGLERSRLDLLRRSGRAPQFAELARGGSIVSIDVPPPPVAESFWTTVATGELADVHGVLHGYELARPSGFARTWSARSVRVPTLWQLADQAAIDVAVVGWPATAQLALVRGTVAAPTIEVALDAPPACPLPPDLLTLGDRAVDVGSLRLHPEESESSDLDLLLDRVERGNDAGRRAASIRCLAETSTLHAIATRWLAERSPRLLAVRLPLLARLAPIWSGLSPRLADDIGIGALQWLDRLIGRYRAIAGAGATFVVIGSGLQPSPGDEDSGLRPGADAFVLASATAGARWRGREAIGLAAVGDALRAEIDLPLPVAGAGRRTLGTDPAGGIRASFEIVTVPERPVLDASTRGVAGIAGIDFGPALEFARRVERQTRLGLAEVRLHAGDRDGAEASLRVLTARFPAFEPGLVLRGCALLEGGRAAESAELLRPLAQARRDDHHGIAARGLVAFAACDWELAEACFIELRERWSSLIEPLPWLAAIALQAGRWSVAEARYRGLATRRPRDVTVAEGLAIAQLAQGHGIDALATLDVALQIAPGRPSLMLLRSVAAERVGQRPLTVGEMVGAIVAGAPRGSLLAAPSS